MNGNERRSWGSRLRRRIVGPNADLHEPMMALTALLWGLVIALWPVEAIGGSPAFRALVRVAPDHVWAGLLILGGAVGLVTYALDVPAARRIWAAVGTFVWSLAAYLLWVQPSPGLGLAFLPVAALFSFFTLLRNGGGSR